jgi:hemerythrin HHE cation binding domain-containing protein
MLTQKESALAVSMSMRENLFRPIHKGLRLMIYESGLRLSITEFTDLPDSNETVSMLRRDLNSAMSNCMLCLLRTHAEHEEQDLFAAVRPYAADTVAELVVQHGQIANRIQTIVRTCDELSGTTDSQRRVDLGDRLNNECNELFTFYLGHLIDEETKVVPLMWEHYTDGELRALRSKFYNRIPVERFNDWMRWTLPALNISELLVFLSGMRAEPAPNRFVEAMRIAKETLDPSRWQMLESEVGHGYSGNVIP